MFRDFSNSCNVSRDRWHRGFGSLFRSLNYPAALLCLLSSVLAAQSDVLPPRSDSVQVLPTTVIDATPIDIFDIGSLGNSPTFSVPSIPPPPGVIPRIGNHVPPTNPKLYMIHPSPSLLRRDNAIEAKRVTDWKILTGKLIVRSTLVGIAVAIAYYKEKNVADAAIGAFLGHPFWGPLITGGGILLSPSRISDLQGIVPSTPPVRNNAVQGTAPPPQH